MRDRNLTTFLIVIFATGGIAVLALSGIRGMLQDDPITVAVGAVGIILALTLGVFRLLNRHAGR